MYFRRLLPILLAILVIVVHLHCICGHGEAAGAPAHHCHNESACFCKGATLTQAVDCAAPEQAWEEIALELVVLSSLSAELELPDAIVAGNGLPPPKLSGRILRAHLSSLVI